jgi:hypothetical protein
MAEHDFEHPRLRDALSNVTRRERQFLLGISLLGITLIKAGLVPSKISGLGIEFQSADQEALLSIVAVVIVYFLVAFIIYATSDYLAWKIAISKQFIESAVSSYEKDILGLFPQPGTADENIQEFKHDLQKKFRFYFKLITPTSIIRALFDFGLPIAVGCYALLLIIKAII